MAVTWDVSKKGTSAALSNGNMTVSISSNPPASVLATIGYSTGKRYFEIKNDNDPNSGLMIGIANSSVGLNSAVYTTSNQRSYWANSGAYYPGGINAGLGYRAGDVIGVAVDLDNGTLSFYKNGTSLGIAFSDIKSMGVVYPFINNVQYYPMAATLHTSASQFLYAIPSGYVAWDSNASTQPPQAFAGGI